jgi:hypothetical protein
MYDLAFALKGTLNGNPAQAAAVRRLPAAPGKKAVRSNTIS